MDSLFLGGILVGFIAGVIVTLAFTTAHFLWVGEETKEADRLERKQRIRQISRGRIRYNDGLDIEDWL